LHEEPRHWFVATRRAAHKSRASAVINRVYLRSGIEERTGRTAAAVRSSIIKKRRVIAHLTSYWVGRAHVPGRQQLSDGASIVVPCGHARNWHCAPPVRAQRRVQRHVKFFARPPLLHETPETSDVPTAVRTARFLTDVPCSARLLDFWTNTRTFLGKRRTCVAGALTHDDHTLDQQQEKKWIAAVGFAKRGSVASVQSTTLHVSTGHAFVRRAAHGM
jgi:hypothetical protein